MSDESKARQLHAKALQLREQKQFLESLQIGEEALFEYAKDKDIMGFSELLSMQAKTYLHAYNFTQFKPYLLLAKETSEASVDIAETYGSISDTILPLFNYGEVAAESGDLFMAIETYRDVVKRMTSHPPKNHNRKSVLANFKIHLTTTEYLNGDTTAFQRAEQALSDLETSTDASDYEKHVWLSGAHMRIAKMLKDDDHQKAQEHLMKAKEIIDADPELVIRKEQWEKLSKSSTLQS